MNLCHVRTRKGLCLKEATAFVTYFLDGCGGKYACGAHIERAMLDVATGPNVGEMRLRVRPVGRLADRINRMRERKR